MRKYIKNQRGFSHHFILPLLAFIAVGAIGAYVISMSRAATAGPSDVVYRQYSSDKSVDGYYRYGSSGSTKYDSSSWDADGIHDVSQDQKWILTHIDGTLTGISTAGSRASYGTYYSLTSDGQACTGPGQYANKALFSKVSAATPTVYFGLIDVACNGGHYASASTTTLYSVGNNGANKKIIKKFSITGSIGSALDFDILSTATNGNVLVRANQTYYVLSSAGKTVFSGSANKLRNFKLSENGKKIAYDIGGSIYVANTNGTSKKRVLAVSDGRTLAGISPAGTYILYQKPLSSDWKKSGLYSYKIASKKSKLLDSGYSAVAYSSSTPPVITTTRWLPGSTTVVYVKQDVKAKTTQILRIGVTGSAKKVLVNIPYDTNHWGVPLF